MYRVDAHQLDASLSNLNRLTSGINLRLLLHSQHHPPSQLPWGPALQEEFSDTTMSDDRNERSRIKTEWELSLQLLILDVVQTMPSLPLVFNTNVVLQESSQQTSSIRFRFHNSSCAIIKRHG
jgi:hypothetical protein